MTGIASEAQKVALVTGATRGIGRVIAETLGAAGVAVVVTGRTLRAGEGRHDGMGGPVPGSIEETVARIVELGGTAFGLRLDLLDRDSIDAAVETTMSQFGRLDILVNNAIYQGPGVRQKIAEIAIAEAERSTLGNFVNQFHLTQRVLEIMVRQGGGRMLFMTALSAVQPTVGSSGLFYNAPKAALNKIPDYVNFEHGKDGVSAFLIEPQFTMTDTLRAVLGDEADNVGFGLVPYDPAETARTVAWLATHPQAPEYAGPHVINAPEFFRENKIDPAARITGAQAYLPEQELPIMPVTAFAYAKVVVKDSDALTPFYTEALGLASAMRVEEGEGDHAFIENFFSAAAGAPPQIVLISYTNRPAPTAGESVVALMVDDVDATLEAITGAGGRITVPAFDIPEHKMRMAYAADPEGHTIELMKVG